MPYSSNIGNLYVITPRDGNILPPFSVTMIASNPAYNERFYYDTEGNLYVLSLYGGQRYLDVLADSEVNVTSIGTTLPSGVTEIPIKGITCGYSSLSELAYAMGVIHVYMEPSEEYRDISFGYGLIILANIGEGSTEIYYTTVNNATKISGGNTGFTVSKISEYITRLTGNGINGLYATMIRTEI